MAARHVAKGLPAHDGEARGIRALVAGLPDNYVVYSNIELATGQRAQTYEHDAVVVAPHGVFAVELKSWGGTITGNRDRWTLADGAFVQSPLPLILAKSRSLKGRLIALRRDLADVWVQGLVFLSRGDAVPHITPDFASLVCTQRDIVQALTTPTAFGDGRRIAPGVLSAVHKFLNDGSATRAPEQINGFHLEQRLAAEDRPYQAWLARRGDDKRVLHVHTVSGEDTAERERTRNHAMREATLHEKLRGGPDLLGYRDFFEVTDDPRRVVLMFDDTTPLVPCDVWVRDRAPGLAPRLAVAARVARSVAWVHARGLVHRRLCPEAVLVTGRSGEAQADVRLTGFDLARDLTAVSQTITGTSLGDPSFRCSAPEALRSGEATARSDLFSLGALLHELFAGRPLFATPDAVLRPFSLVPFDVGGRQVPPAVFRTLVALLHPDPAHRPAGAEEVAEALEAAHAELTKVATPTEWAVGREVRGSYVLKQRLGRGSTSTTWLATHLHAEGVVVLKIAEAVHAPHLREEYRIGRAVKHTNVVDVLSIEPEGDHIVLGLAFVEGVTATLWAGAGDPFEPARFLDVARGLLGGLHALHEAGFLHRDVKPDNVMLREPDARVTLVDLGLAANLSAEGGLAVGTVQYKDPLLYAEGRWTKANDQYAAFLVLYQLLTGAHPFGSAAPDSGHEPAIEPELFPDSFSPAAAKALAGVFVAALSPTRERRPRGIPEALVALDGALASARPSRTRSADTAALPEAAAPGDLVNDLPLSVRAQGALARLAVVTVGDFAALDAPLLARLPNVGAKTTRELLAYADQARARWPDLPTEAPAALERYYPALANDERLLGSVELGLSKGQTAAFGERGIRTVGDLARMPLVALAGLPNFPVERRDATRKHLVRLAGRDGGFDGLDALDEALRAEVGDRAYAALAAVVGLNDGHARDFPGAGELLGVSRQRIHQLIDTDDLRKPGSVGRQLVGLVEELLPAVGFAGLDEVAEALTNRLPLRPRGAVSASGYARLAALLLRDDLRPTDAGGLEYVARPPWRVEALPVLVEALEDTVQWPPRFRRTLEATTWDALDEDTRRALVRWGADATGLLDALLALSPNLRIDALGALYLPPVPLVDALIQLRPVGTAQASAEELVIEARSRWEGVGDCDDLALTLEQAGYRLDGGVWSDPGRVSLASPVVNPIVDATVPRQRAGPEAGVVRSLVAQVDRGGVRVVVMRPESAHRCSRELVGWLRAELGDDRVRFEDVDRTVIDALKAAELWEQVPYFEANPKADWGWVADEVRPALRQLERDARPGVVTVFARPALLGTLGLMDWLSGFYERARGGTHGLVVFAIPGGVHDDRVRLNERYNLACTPDMGAVFLESV
ncbi:hypothetical protein LBMAG42_03580 [Deltaproteobacteria bacterium]|nr:hypothetical protein LBMAG42_03580 [Deltaproteobacteria bacterium]